MFRRTSLPGVSALTLALSLVLPAVGSAASWRPRLGIEGGASLGRPSVSDAIGSRTHWKLGGSAGLLARWELVPGWSLEAAPGWERVAGRGTGTISFSSTGGGGTTTGSFDIDQTLRFDRIALPVRAAYRPGNSAWALEGGFSTAWLARVDRTSRLVAGSPSLAPGAMARRRAGPSAAIFEEVGTFDTNDWTNRFHRWDVAVAAGVGRDQSIAGHLFRARVRWLQGLVDIGRFNEAVRLSEVSATLGLLW